MSGGVQIKIGGATAAQLMARLEEAGVQLNPHARRYFADERFSALPAQREIALRLCTPEELGCGEGASLQTIFACAKAKGLALCPPEAAVYLRLAMLDQRKSTSSVLTGTHSAPEGAITVAAELLRDDDDFPKGLYLRQVEGVLWLRGYLCTEEYGWPADSVFAFEE